MSNSRLFERALAFKHKLHERLCTWRDRQFRSIAPAHVPVQLEQLEPRVLMSAINLEGQFDLLNQGGQLVEQATVVADLIVADPTDTYSFEAQAGQTADILATGAAALV
jgi:hypothetical protein